MKVTADTITDEQIRDWESSVLAESNDGAEKCRVVDLATRALVELDRHATRAQRLDRRVARTHCAKFWTAWNARHGGDR